jgi:hypothetical protein
MKSWHLWALLFAGTYGCTVRSELETREDGPAFIALDNQRSPSERQAAARLLNEHESRALRDVLVARFPGKYDRGAMGDLFVLNIVGDAECAQLLKSKQHDPQMPGKLRSALDMLIQELDTRGNAR